MGRPCVRCYSMLAPIVHEDRTTSWIHQYGSAVDHDDRSFAFRSERDHRGLQYGLCKVLISGSRDFPSESPFIDVLMYYCAMDALGICGSLYMMTPTLAPLPLIYLVEPSNGTFHPYTNLVTHKASCLDVASRSSSKLRMPEQSPNPWPSRYAKYFDLDLDLDLDNVDSKNTTTVHLTNFQPLHLARRRIPPPPSH